MSKQYIKKYLYLTRAAVLLVMMTIVISSALQDTTTCISNRCLVDTSASGPACQCSMNSYGNKSCGMSTTKQETLRRGCNCVVMPIGLDEAIVESGSRSLQRDHAVTGDTIPAIIRSQKLDHPEWTRLIQHPPNRSEPILCHIRAVVLLI